MAREPPLDAAASRPYAEVAVPVPVPRTFHYAVPPELDAAVQPGVRVLVPFGRRTVTAYCVGRSATAAVAEVKSVLRALDPAPLLDAGMLRLGVWMSGYYRASLGDVLEAVLPAGVRRPKRARAVRVVRLLVSPSHAAELEAGLRLKRAKAQAGVIALLASREGGEATTAELARAVKGAGATFRPLVAHGYVTIETRRVETPDPHPEAPAPGAGGATGGPSPEVEPTAAQVAALAQITSRLAGDTFAVVLLHGVTGSGKTEVYLRAIAATRDAGRQAILLVPEIALTPQTVARIAGRFPRTAVLHSHLPDPERRREWERIRAGAVDVVVGARSAVFAPCPRLGLVVVDEEHEPSFKQESTPRYHARDVAIMRAQDAHAVVLLGSATPSLESWRNAVDGRYTLCRLPERVAGGALPPVEIIDLEREWDALKGVTALSRPLRAAIGETLARGEQAILFLNRRGFATALRCPKCGHVWRCAACDVALTFHRVVERILCHYCGVAQPLPTVCPECRHPKPRLLGTGTQRLEGELAAAFPQARIARMDSDSMRRVGAYETTLRAVREGTVDIVVGTQMVAKGHDIPTVTLVGVVFADTGLHLPDFRSAERTFQVVAQVAGRAGRGERPGRVLVQTLTPDHYSIVAAAAHDFEAFARAELAHRCALLYPPFTRLARCVIAGKDRAKAWDRALALADALRPAVDAARGHLLGPAPAPLPRLQGRFRFHLLVKAPSTAAVRACLAPLDAPDFARKARGIDITVDVDPVSVL